MVKGLASGEEEEDRVTVTDPHKIVRIVKTKNIESRVSTLYLTDTDVYK